MGVGNAAQISSSTRLCVITLVGGQPGTVSLEGLRLIWILRRQSV
jgi:hypothetical protein